ncbi:hypothetical protein B0T14DRAFT_491768 [Immersiella caudata]|uniref:RRM domain-containing protein n=1 Tax=Immersiella caudata TaxID=314043 RepID=A0AA39XIB1_9PEZI|nr:hypothetical protein B0T14DRAFT_491768 [Immersiella caudata]
MGKSSSKKRSRAAEEDAAEPGDFVNGEQTAPIVKKSKIDESGKAEVTKSDTPSKKDKKEKKKDKDGRKEKKEKKEKKNKEVEEEEEENTKEKKRSKKEKKDKKEKKEKKTKSKGVASEDEDVAMENGATDDAPVVNGRETPSKNSKKDKKDKEKKFKKAVDEGDDEKEPSADADADPDTSNKANRFICFVGNLPFTATADAVKEHFAKVHPTHVRLLTERDDPSKSRGIAFIEFANFDHMKTCLEKFHHTEFDNGKSAPRKINVELTAGGGGKTSHRQQKIASKNKKLNEERHNRFAKEEEAKLEKAVEKATEEPQSQQDAGWIHPSRLGFVPHENQTQEQRDEAAAQLAKTEGTWNGSGGKFRNKNSARGGGRGGHGGGRGGGKFRGRR